MAFDLAGRIAVRFVRVSVGIGAGGLFLYHTVPHALPVNICLSAFGSEGENVSESCREQFKERAQKMNLKNPDRVTLFVNKGFSGFSAGSTSLPTGAVVGIPGWYQFKTPEDVMNSPINFKGRTIKWESEMGSQIKDSLISTPENISFTIGHEIAHLQSPEYKVINAVLSPSWLLATYKLASVTPRLAALPVLVDVILKVCILRLSYLGYKRVTKEIQHKEEFLADEMSARTDLEAALGGVNYLSKRLQLNQVLRALHGDQGLSYYDEDGNEIKMQQHPKLTERIKKIQQIVDEHLKKENEGLLEDDQN
ncbi:transmembrane protein 177-like [Actinia tenebrosa]|uniref:Transmembrane protein 177-like n=1 Tax=Actinia tenebrosa TaxID=6105 RepID=A0A6P8HGI1_ACTTE|nr:transmembrane protein 177-like [Actinia tenebrosa]